LVVYTHTLWVKLEFDGNKIHFWRVKRIAMLESQQQKIKTLKNSHQSHEQVHKRKKNENTRI